ncbi:hypothetical protein N7462_003883 [Penicillium macrosclerotiorum]|uniref:uncharacterized protein n=1 Tax=Penicillium macrosclerotiorum TaxID=303699 RepID=UPI002547AB19|nr:uncharacterized protein N7462_003883 [Penicillium macrosclerotiorum]KAJ5689491.1 hypothetical protein N7462_003883 [Penicillium macrosclerotiorum]
MRSSVEPRLYHVIYRGLRAPKTTDTSRRELLVPSRAYRAVVSMMRSHTYQELLTTRPGDWVGHGTSSLGGLAVAYVEEAESPAVDD